MTSIATELSRILKIQWLDTLPASDLAFWLIHSFTPERFRAGDRDVIEYACRLLYQRSHAPLLIVEFIDRLWGMHGLKPDYCPNIFHSNVVSFRRNINASKSL